MTNGVAAGSGIATLQETSSETATANMAAVQLSSANISEAAIDTAAAQAKATSVDSNVISTNTIASNADDGIELKGATNTNVASNIITGNGTTGIYLAAGTSGSMISLNTISGNKAYGIKANGMDVVDNQWTKNTVFNNMLGGIVSTSGANNGIPAPTVIQKGKSVTITTQPGTTVEVYSDDNAQGQYFEARMNTSNGTITLSKSWKGSIVNAFVTDADGNSSGFAINRGLAVETSKIFIPVVAIKQTSK